MELPQVLLSTIQCHPSCAASLCGSQSKPETALTFRKPCWCYCSRVLVPDSLDKTAEYHVQCLKQRWEATPYFQGSPLESATWQQKHQFIVKVTLSPSLRENPQIHRRRDFSAWSPADSNGQTASSGIWPQKRTVLEAHLQPTALRTQTSVFLIFVFQCYLLLSCILDLRKYSYSDQDWLCMACCFSRI